MTERFLDGRFSADDPEGLATECIEVGADSLLLDQEGLPPAFFDLSSGALGALLHRLDLYRIPLAAVVPDVQKHSKAFQDFVRESNRGRRFRFFATRAEAIAWLHSPEEG